MKKFHLIISLAMLAVTSHLMAQEPLPAMYVEKHVGIDRIMRFSQVEKSKYEILRKLNGYQDLFFIYTRDAVDDLIAKINMDYGIRIYFARYNECDGSSLPAVIEDNKVILLFATESKDSTVSPKKYYFLNDKRADNKVYEVSKECGEAWIYDYWKNVVPNLAGTLSENQPDDIDPRDTGVYSDTKSIRYTTEMISKAFTSEETLDHKRAGVQLFISAYKISFSAYDENGNGSAGLKDVYKSRLFVQIDYMYKTATGNEVFYLDDMDDFKQRDAARKRQHLKSLKKPAMNKIIKEDTKKALNNGQLCPTHCPPPPPPTPVGG